MTSISMIDERGIVVLQYDLSFSTIALKSAIRALWEDEKAYRLRVETKGEVVYLTRS